MAYIIITKYIALAVSARLAHENEAELSGHFNPYMVRIAKSFKEYADVSAERKIASKLGSLWTASLESGGLYRALWEIPKETARGMRIDLKSVPVRQESIEICEYFSLNPYEVDSTGSLLIVTQNATETLYALKEAGIEAAVIGSTNNGSDRVLLHNGVRSFLNRPGYSINQ